MILRVFLIACERIVDSYLWYNCQRSEEVFKLLEGFSQWLIWRSILLWGSCKSKLKKGQYYNVKFCYHDYSSKFDNLAILAQSRLSLNYFMHERLVKRVANRSRLPLKSVEFQIILIRKLSSVLCLDLYVNLVT